MLLALTRVRNRIFFQNTKEKRGKIRQEKETNNSKKMRMKKKEINSLCVCLEIRREGENKRE